MLPSELKVAQSCLTLCDPMDYTVHEILQARILEWVSIPFSRGSSQPRDQTQVSHIAGRFFTSWAIISFQRYVHLPPDTLWNRKGLKHLTPLKFLIVVSSCFGHVISTLGLLRHSHSHTHTTHTETQEHRSSCEKHIFLATALKIWNQKFLVENLYFKQVPAKILLYSEVSGLLHISEFSHSVPSAVKIH